MIDLDEEYLRHLDARLARKPFEQVVNHSIEEMGEFIVAVNKFRRKHLDPSSRNFNTVTPRMIEVLISQNDTEAENLLEELSDCITLLLTLKKKLETSNPIINQQIGRKVIAKNRKWLN